MHRLLQKSASSSVHLWGYDRVLNKCGFVCQVMLDASHGYTKKVDVWSIGVILYILLSAVPPYDPQIGSAELARRSIRFPQPQFAGVSSEAKDLILQVSSLLCCCLWCWSALKVWTGIVNHSTCAICEPVPRYQRRNPPDCGASFEPSLVGHTTASASGIGLRRWRRHVCTIFAHHPC